MYLQINDIINEQYQVIKELGSGGFGNTYLVKDLKDSNNALRVLKELIPKTSKPSNLKKTEKIFKKETKALQKLGKHPFIPNFYDAFEKEQKFYLVQEYIEGYDLSEEIKQNKFTSETKVIELLKEVLNIIQFIHQNHVIHNDIKPDNLMRRDSDNKIVLIDFGAVKTINSLNNNDYTSSIIGVPVYMAPEKLNGKFQLNSDIYSLGIVMIQALTGLHPVNFVEDKGNDEIKWRNFANVSNSLANILDKMVRSNYRERYQSAKQILEDLEKINNPNQSIFNLQLNIFKNYLKFIFLFSKEYYLGLSLMMIMGIGIFVFNNNNNKSEVSISNQLKTKSCSLIIGDHLSCGEEILTADENLEEKQKGIQAFSEKKYLQAVELLEQSTKVHKDPESLIYLNNAQLINNNIPFYTIAVIAPIGDHIHFGDSGKEILRGVAQVQTNINKNRTINGFGLRIVIVDDYGSANLTPEKIAHQLVKQTDILAVIGHSTSSATEQVLDIYKENKLVLISPTNTAENLTSKSDFFFRTVPKNSQMTKALSDYLINTLKSNQVAVFYNTNSIYSKSMKHQFSQNFGEESITLFDLSEKNFNPEEILKEFTEKDIKSLVFFPDAKINSNALNNVLKIIRANKNRYFMLGGDSLYTDNILEEKQAHNLVIAIPKYSLNNFNNEFIDNAKKLWGEEFKITWRTVAAYDAIRVIEKALQNNESVTRESIQKILTAENFEANGATEKIYFDNEGNLSMQFNDNSKSIVELVQVKPDPCYTNYSNFLPINQIDFSCN